MTMIDSTSYVARVCPPAEMTDAERGDAYQLLARHFDGVTRQQFEHDLVEKNCVLSLRDAASGTLTGLSTMLVYETSVDGSPISVVCSGDTVVDPSAWSSPA